MRQVGRFFSRGFLGRRLVTRWFVACWLIEWLDGRGLVGRFDLGDLEGGGVDGDRGVVYGSLQLYRVHDDRVARAMVRCLRKPRGEVWTSPLARIGFGASVMMPGLTDWVLGRMVERRSGTTH